MSGEPAIVADSSRRKGSGVSERAVEVAVTVWSEIKPLDELPADVSRELDRLEPLKTAWNQQAEQDPETFKETRLRELRSHAVETGIIERLYDLDWGVTQALVAEGISRDVLERNGGHVNEETLRIIHDQYEALEYVTEAARGPHQLTVHFIRQLHELITAHQPTYEATDVLGRLVSAPLVHGDWKTQPNHVTRPNGTTLEYCPPERVQDQMESLVDLADSNREAHPVVRAAWLHHRFIQIHPFQDGNGRVARALVLLELLRAEYAPVVVSRDSRDDYLEALDRANDGDLAPLVLFIAAREQAAMLRQFQAPIAQRPFGSVLDVARGAARRLEELQREADTRTAASFAAAASGLHTRLVDHMTWLAAELEKTFREVADDSRVWIRSGRPGERDSTHHHGQLVKLAKRHGFYANLSDGSWWTTLTLNMPPVRMIMLVAIVKVGAGETGVGSVLVQAERRTSDPDDGHVDYEWLFEPAESDKMAIVAGAAVEDLWSDVDALVERALSAAIVDFTARLG